MSQFWRVSAVTSVGLFLESCAFFFVISVAAVAIHLPQAGLPLWLVFLALLASYFLSTWIQSLPYTRGLRGMIGLAVSLVFLLVLSYALLSGYPTKRRDSGVTFLFLALLLQGF